jgi:hypothetical protein
MFKFLTYSWVSAKNLFNSNGCVLQKNVNFCDSVIENPSQKFTKL